MDPHRCSHGSRQPSYGTRFDGERNSRKSLGSYGYPGRPLPELDEADSRSQSLPASTRSNFDRSGSILPRWEDDTRHRDARRDRYGTDGYDRRDPRNTFAAKTANVVDRLFHYRNPPDGSWLERGLANSPSGSSSSLRARSMGSATRSGDPGYTPFNEGTDTASLASAGGSSPWTKEAGDVPSSRQPSPEIRKTRLGSARFAAASSGLWYSPGDRRSGGA